MNLDKERQKDDDLFVERLSLIVVLVLLLVVGIAMMVEKKLDRAREIRTVQIEVAPMLEPAERRPIAVPVDIYDRSKGKVVVDVSVVNEILITTTIRDEGAMDILALCVVGKVDIGLVANTKPNEVPGERAGFPTSGHFACVASVGLARTGDILVARLVNRQSTEQQVLVEAGLVGANERFEKPGHGADNPYWGCDVRRGTKEEGMEGSLVGIWPRPIQDCHPNLLGGWGPIENDICPPPCP